MGDGELFRGRAEVGAAGGGPPGARDGEAGAPVIELRDVCVRAPARAIVRNVSLCAPPNQVTALIGPSGAGKSTLLKVINRLTDLAPGLRVTGEVLFRGRDVRAPGVAADRLRTRIGMLFQQPIVFPKSVYQNVIFGVRHVGNVPRRRLPEVAERALREAAIWDEVKDRLHEPAARLSVGQQQRLCLARTLAGSPEVILMDEPTSALDPRSTQSVEELIVRLKARHAIVLVTHNVAQARRTADRLACLCVTDGVGELVEAGRCHDVLTNPQSPALRAYLRHAEG
jgi:phosphate transport system ATP-binding protein